MTLSIPPELEQHISSLVLRGEYPNAEAVLVDAVKALLREQERERIESFSKQMGLMSLGSNSFSRKRKIAVTTAI